MIKSEKPKGNYKLILTALIVCDEFLYKFSTKYNSKFFHASFAQNIADWCLNFYEKYNEAPKSHIQDIYDNSIRENTLQASSLELIEDLLNSISDEFDSYDFNIDYLLDETKKLQKEQDLEALKKELSDVDDYDEVAKIINERKIIEDSDEIEFTEPLKDVKLADKISEAMEPPLFCFPGALGDLINSEFRRGCFTSIRAASGMGKTFCDITLIHQAIKCRNNIVSFQLGDSSEQQFSKRLVSVMSATPPEPLNKNHWRPTVDCWLNAKNSCGMIHRKSIGSSIVDAKGELIPYEAHPKEYVCCDYCHVKNKKHPLLIYKKPYQCTREMDESIIKKTQKRKSLLMRSKRFYSLVVPSQSLNVSDIEERLIGLYKEDNFVPDVIFLDYEGLLRDEKGGLDTAENIQLRYSKLRSLCLRMNILIVIFEQSDVEGYDVKKGSMRNFTWSREKNNEVSGIINLCATEDDKKMKLRRVNKSKSRDSDSEEKSIIVLTDLACGQLFLDSFDSTLLQEELKEESKEKPKKDDTKT